MTGLVQEVGFGLRQWRTNIGFTSVAVVTLALGIGANTAIFSLLKPQPLALFGKGSWRGRSRPDG